MAGIDATLQSSEVQTGTTKQTLLQIEAPTNQRLKVNEISVSFKGTSNTAAPVLVEVVRQSTNGTGGVSVTPYPTDEGVAETLQATGLEDIDTTQPTQTNVLMREEVHPQGGYSWTAPFGKGIEVKGAGILGIAVTAGADVAAVLRFGYEE